MRPAPRRRSSRSGSGMTSLGTMPRTGRKCRCPSSRSPRRDRRRSASCYRRSRKRDSGASLGSGTSPKRRCSRGSSGRPSERPHGARGANERRAGRRRLLSAPSFTHPVQAKPSFDPMPGDDTNVTPCFCMRVRYLKGLVASRLLIFAPAVTAPVTIPMPSPAAAPRIAP
jgi:hypothetical protein